MTCRGIALLLSERQDHGLSLPGLFAIRIHLALCVFCRRIEHQLDIIRQLSRRIGCAGDSSPLEDRQIMDAELSPDAKARMKKALGREKSLRTV
jgi:hypothetical protein